MFDVDLKWYIKRYLIACYENFKLKKEIEKLKEENKKLKSYVDIDYWEEDVAR